MDPEDVFESLVEWLKTFDGVPTEDLTASVLATGVHVAAVLSKLDSEFFNAEWLSKLQPVEISSNWRIKAANLKKIIKSVRDYYSQELSINIAHIPVPDANIICERLETKELGQLLQLVLGIAVNCRNNEVFVQRMMNLDEAVQVVIKYTIEDLQGRQRPRSFMEYSPQNDQCPQSVQELHTLREANVVLSRRCFELEGQVTVLREESAALRSADRSHSRSSESREKELEETSAAATKKISQLQESIEDLQEELYKMEKVKEEFRTKSEKLEQENKEILMKLEESSRRESDYQKLKDEVDELRIKADEARKLQSSFDVYKKRLEELSDLKAQNKILEDKNTSLIKAAIEFEEEQRKNNTLRTQLDACKAEINDAQTRLENYKLRFEKEELAHQELLQRFQLLTEERNRFADELVVLKEKDDEKHFSMIEVPPEVSRSERTYSQQSSIISCPPEIKEQILRLEHECKKLRETEASYSVERANLEKRIQDLIKAKNSIEDELISVKGRVAEYELMLKDINFSGSVLNDQKFSELQKQLEVKDSLLKSQESKFKSCLDKARTVIQALEQSKSLISEPVTENRYGISEVEESLQQKLSEKEQQLQKLQEEQERMQIMKEQEERLVTTAFHNMAIKLFRRSCHSRLQPASSESSVVLSSFLGVQRDVITRRPPSENQGNFPRSDFEPTGVEGVLEL